MNAHTKQQQVKVFDTDFIDKNPTPLSRLYKILDNLITIVTLTTHLLGLVLHRKPRVAGTDLEMEDEVELGYLY